MFNFLNPKLMPKVVTNVACMDGYEAENLISNNLLTKSRGFIAFTSIKPPVDITFQLICPVNIHYIAISTVNGTQKTNGIEVLAKNPKSEIICMAQAIFEQPGIVFCNSRVYSKSIPPPNCQNFHLAFFKSHTFRQFTNASEVKIRIIRTDRNTVPCLNKIEIWGNVSKICSQVTMKTIERIMNENKSNDVLTCEKPNLQIDDFQIPDDFKDAITYEIMAVPMTLPSGHTVDQSTIEKCISNDSIYGRQGTDPFTGLRYTETRKPVLNVSLKARIDMFLVEHAHRKEIASVHRTVGAITNNSAPQKRSFHSMANNESSIKCNSVSESSIIDYKKLKLDSSASEESLMDTINKVMSSVNFVRFTEEADDKPSVKCCETCNTTESLYELPCLHLYCRLCLLELCKTLQCERCKTAFSRSEPKKFHVV